MAKDKAADQPKKDAPKPSKREQQAQTTAKAGADAMRKLAEGEW